MVGVGEAGRADAALAAQELELGDEGVERGGGGAGRTEEVELIAARRAAFTVAAGARMAIP